MPLPLPFFLLILFIKVNLIFGIDDKRYYHLWTKESMKWNKISVDVASTSPSLDAKKDLFHSEVSDKKYFTSQVGQPEFISMLFNHKKGGYFVDLAANHYNIFSNTQALERYYDWEGICIEPNTEYRQGILENRHCQLAINPVYSISGKKVHFRMKGNAPGEGGVFGGIVEKDMDSRIARKTDEILETVTLNNLLSALNAPNVIDYFSLDVEGGEHHVLKHFDFGLYTFLTMTIERPIGKLGDLCLCLCLYQYLYVSRS
jgi:hypothetical protein